jgi:hypothetical protein
MLLSANLFAGVARAVPSLQTLLEDASRQQQVTVNLLTIKLSPEAERLGEKLTKAINANPTWWMNYVRDNIDKHPLPYHKNLGMSEAEYRRYLVVVEDRYFAVHSTRTLSVHRTGTDSFALDGGDDIPWITGIALDLRTAMATIPGVRRPLSGTQKSDVLLRPVGKWQGLRWQLDEGGDTPPTEHVHTVCLEVGATEGGNLIVSYRNKEMTAGASQRAVDLVLVTTESR